MCAKIMKEHHAELDEAEVSVLCLFVDAGMDDDDEPKPAIKKDGHECAAQVKKTTAPDRVAGLPDALIIIDFHKWENLAAGQREALIDHELEHLDLKYGKEGELKRDCFGRPELEYRKHDWVLAGFSSIVERHGVSALETTQFRELNHTTGGQMVFDFIEQMRVRREETVA
jgi:hypothetical protein